MGEEQQGEEQNAEASVSAAVPSEQASKAVSTQSTSAALSSAQTEKSAQQQETSQPEEAAQGLELERNHGNSRHGSEGGDARVKYGQCWAFAGLGTAVLRSVGIPSRSVTNFDSAHEAETEMPVGIGPVNGGFVTVTKDEKGDAKWVYDTWVESHVAAGGSKNITSNLSEWNKSCLEATGASVCNIHVRTESYTSSAKAVSGWNAVDGTPQERSAAWLQTASHWLRYRHER